MTLKTQTAAAELYRLLAGTHGEQGERAEETKEQARS